MAEINNQAQKIISLVKIRNKYILENIFDYLDDVKYLDIIRYNNAIQKKLKINKRDYKNEYFKIKIDIL